jgi:citrate lyase subunit beta/citryl-CoA lyase
MFCPRSYLFVPGDRPERFPKAVASGADVVIFDLEDSVAPFKKHAARYEVSKWLTSGNVGLVRINAPNTEWYTGDLGLALLPGTLGLVVPKAEQASDLAFIGSHMSNEQIILPIIESAAGMADLINIATLPRVSRLVFGSIDFQLDLDIDGDGDELLYFRSHLVFISRVAGIDKPVDGVSIALSDEEALKSDTERSRRLGFGGKLCIHPSQVKIINDFFLPGTEDISWALRVKEATIAANGAAVSVDGKMVDRPVLLKAERILSLANMR